MKKLTLLLMGLVLSLHVFGGEFVPMYQIIKDTVNKGVPVGKCLIYGTITYEGTPINSGKVSTVDHKSYGVSDSVGGFSFLMDASETKLYSFQIGYREVVTDLHTFKSGHSVRIEFYLREKHIMFMEEKPVIYMYSPNQLTANVTLDLKGELTFTYPEYKEGWNVVVNQSGSIRDVESGKNYPYLFWEGQIKNLSFTSSFNAFDGYQINTDSTISFLESKLSGYGLNVKEQTDFITYWAPRINQKEYATVQFLVDEDYGSEIGLLSMKPKPDCMRRVYLLFASSDEAIERFTSLPKKVLPFYRNGFTVIEWGGSEIQLNLETSKL